MQRKFQQSARGACASLAVLLTVGLIGPAQAAGLSPGTDDPRAPAAQCSDAGEGCARIRGHIPAASDFAGAETIGGPPASFGSPPAPLDSGRGLFLLQVSHDQTAR